MHLFFSNRIVPTIAHCSLSVLVVLVACRDENSVSILSDAGSDSGSILVDSSVSHDDATVDEDAMVAVVDADVHHDAADMTPCESGYRGSVEDGCVDINECTIGNGGCPEACINTTGSFRCWSPDTTRISIPRRPVETRANSYHPSFSPDGTQILFRSWSPNLVLNDRNGASDVFLKNLATDETVRISTAADGTEADESSVLPLLSPSGTKVVFVSAASNLVPGDSDDWSDIFIKDLESGEVTLVAPFTSERSIAWNAVGAGEDAFYQPRFSPDGTKLVFISSAPDIVSGDTNDRDDVFVKDLASGEVSRISVTVDGIEANHGSQWASFSPDGTKVVFASQASNLVPADTNAYVDVFVKDLDTGEIARVSIAANGTEPNGRSDRPTFSPDGRHIAFYSTAWNLEPSDTGVEMDVFVKNLDTGEVKRVAEAMGGGFTYGGVLGASFSADGTKMVFVSGATDLVPDDSNMSTDVFVIDLDTDAVSRISLASGGADTNAYSAAASFSPDGTKIVFDSGASNLVPDDTNGRADIFVKDLITGEITRVSVASDAFELRRDLRTPSLSPDGTKLLFASSAPNLVSGDTNGLHDMFVMQLATGVVTRISVASDGAQSNGESYIGSFSPDGMQVLFESSASNLVPGDTNGVGDIFVKDLVSGVVTRVSVAADGAQIDSQPYSASFASNGTTVVFGAVASNLVPGDTNEVGDIFIKDLSTGAVTRVSVAADGAQGNGESFQATLSADGTLLAFSSSASNLVANDTNNANDVFVRNLLTGEVTRASVTTGGDDANGNSFDAALSPDGTTLAFVSCASNLILDDTNEACDVFVKSLLTGEIRRISTALDGGAPNSHSSIPRFSSTGTHVVFVSRASNLVPDDTNAASDVFAVELATNATIRLSVGITGAGSNGESSSPVFDHGGTRVVFESTGSNLVLNDINGSSDIFVVTVP